MITKIKLLSATAVLSMLSACGGGGDGGTPTPVSTPLSISTAPLKNLRQIATSSTFSISGNCSGTGTENAGAPYATNLYGAVYGKTYVTTLNYTNCTGSGASTNNRYYDSNFSTLAILASDGKFTEGTVVNALPATVKVGDTLTLSNLRTFANSSKSAQIQTGVQSIVVEADTSTSVILNVITQIYDSSNRLTSTGQFRYRLSSNAQVKELIYRMDSPTGQTETWTYN
jgi:hypothetical protein